MELLPDGIPTWAIIGIICGIIAGVPLVLGGLGGYIYETLDKNKEDRTPDYEKF